MTCGNAFWQVVAGADLLLVEAGAPTEAGGVVELVALFMTCMRSSLPAFLPAWTESMLLGSFFSM